MTLLDFEELTSYWAEHPPVHILVAAYLGIGSKKIAGCRASDASGRTHSGRARF
jgi:hypothetical protein